MKFSEAMSNAEITAIRKKHWANRNDRLNLPPMIEGYGRGMWANLDAYDGIEQKQTEILALTCDDGKDDWEVWLP